MSDQGEKGRVADHDGTSARDEWIRAYAVMLVMAILVLNGWRMIWADV